MFGLDVLSDEPALLLDVRPASESQELIVCLLLAAVLAATLGCPRRPQRWSVAGRSDPDAARPAVRRYSRSHRRVLEPSAG